MTAPERYDCEEAFRRLDEFVDRELPPEQMECVRTHLERCAGCAREFDFETAVLEDLREKLRRIHAPDELRRRIAELLAERGAGS